MDNVTDALYMAFGMLMFVIAITITMSSFTVVRVAATSIIDSLDKETEYTYYYGTEDNTESGELQTKRIVGKETIVPTLYRAYFENYTVRFLDSDGNAMNLYKTMGADRQYYETNEVDLNNGTIGSYELSKEFINALVNGDLKDLLIKPEFSNFKILDDGLQGKTFYGIINNGNVFEETLGIYYQEDLQENLTDDINKTEKRVITYQIK